MREYLGKYGVYVVAGFVVVFLATLAFIVILRLRAAEQTKVATVSPTPTTQVSQTPAPTTPPSDSFAQLSFSLQLSPTATPTGPTIATPTTTTTARITPTAAITGGPVALAGAWECTNLTASPLEGTAPLTVRLTATAKKPSAATSVSFDFVFGDDAEQTIEKVSSSGKTTETQDISHTYTKSGNFTASVFIPDENGRTTDPKQLCQVDVAVGGLLAKGPTVIPTETSNAASQTTVAPSPTKALIPTLVPTSVITARPLPSDTPIPVPKLPEPGAFLPTALAVVGGIAVILLGILL